MLTTFPRHASVFTVFLVSACSLVGCDKSSSGPVTLFLDGAGWFAGSGPVSAGLREAGDKGDFETFVWSSGLGPAHDHLLVAGNKSLGRRLARKVEKLRQGAPNARINVIALSAGTSVVLNALEQLKPGVVVDNVVLLSSSASGSRDLTPLMHHVRGRLYATCSTNDGILSGLITNADHKGGDPAGLSGFRPPRNNSPATRAAYSRVVNLHWKPAYLAYDWNGGHTAATNRKFIAAVIAPRILSDEPYPADRPVMAGP